MSDLLEKEPAEKESFEFIDHIKTCTVCKSRWELGEETKKEFKHIVSSIKPSTDLKRRIVAISEEKRNVIYLKPLLLAASVAFLLGIGLFSNALFTKIPSLGSIHNSFNYQISANNINPSQEKFKPIEPYIPGLQEANFKIDGTSKITRLFRNDINLASFKNNSGKRLSVCILPGNYNLPNCHKIEVNGTIFHCGHSEDCQFAYWREKNKTIAFVSDSLTSEEMISIALSTNESA
jgi:hypothetical protein